MNVLLSKSLLTLQQNETNVKELFNETEQNYLSIADFTHELDKINNLLISFALKLTRNMEDAKDLVQDTMIRAYENRDKFLIGTNFKAWCTTIMRNTFINNCRKKARTTDKETPLDNMLFGIPNHKVDNNALSMLLYDELRSAIDQIGSEFSVPFLMFFGGYQYDEIAAQLNLPLGTVKSRIFFARKKIKTILDSQAKQTA